MKKTILSALTAFAIVGSAFSSANAALLAYEGFDYQASTPEAATTFMGQSGGSGFTGNWYSGGAASRPVLPGSLSYPNSVAYTPTGNSAQITTAGEFFANQSRNLDTSATLLANAGNSRYISFLLKSDGPSTNYSQFGLANQVGGNNSPRVTLGINGTSFRLEASGASAAAGSSLTFGTATLGTTYLFVGKIVNDGLGQSVASMNVYAPGAIVPSTEGTYQAVTSSFTSFDINRIWGYQGTNSAITVDEFRIGDTYADVVAVPEPSTVGLVGMGALALATRRRRA